MKLIKKVGKKLWNVEFEWYEGDVNGKMVSMTLKLNSFFARK